MWYGRRMPGSIKTFLQSGLLSLPDRPASQPEKFIQSARKDDEKGNEAKVGTLIITSHRLHIISCQHKWLIAHTPTYSNQLSVQQF